MRKVAIITGGARGIGLGAARKFAQEGFDLTLVGSSDVSRVGDAVAELEGLGARALYVQANIAVAGDRQSILDKTLAAYGRVDVLVNNAGVGSRVRADILCSTEDEFDYVVGINTKGTYFLTQLVANHMIAELQTIEGIKPKIVNVSSISATVASVNRGEYCISKAGVSMVTRLFAARLAEYGITVNEIRPGIILTDMVAPAKEKYDKIFEETDMVPIGHWGYPADCGEAIYALCSDGMSYVTGECLHVDGGFNIQRL